MKENRDAFKGGAREATHRQAGYHLPFSATGRKINAGERHIQKMKTLPCPGIATFRRSNMKVRGNDGFWEPKMKK